MTGNVTQEGKALKVNVKFKVKEVSRNNTNEAIQMLECIEYPELAVMRERKRFMWKERFFVLDNDGKTEREFPTLKSAVIHVLNERGIGGLDG